MGKLLFYRQASHKALRRGHDAFMSASCRFPTVDDPRRAELISEHTEALCSERLLDRHFDRAFLCQGLEDTLGFRRGSDVKRHSKTLRFLKAIGSKISALQYLVADRKGGVEDLVLPVRRCLAVHRRFSVSHCVDDLAYETYFVRR